MKHSLPKQMSYGSPPFPVAPKPGEGGNQRGGLGKAAHLFGDQLTPLLEELNTVLVA
jgi:hypothetical protein